MSSMHAFAPDSSDSSEEEEVTDFLHPSTDPRADERLDYNPRKRRRTGRDAKESAALGVFGSESEDEGYRPGRQWKGKGQAQGRGLRQKGMSFVKTGEKSRGVDEDGEEDEDEEEEEGGEDVDMQDADVQEESNAPMGLGFAPPKSKGLGMGMGFQSPAPRKQNFTPARSSSAGASGTPLGRGFVPSSAAVPILDDDFEDEVSTPRISRPSAFSTPTSNGTGRGGGGGGAGGKKGQPAPGVNAGSFAARMMAKMGYKEGDGLGKEGQGRSNVIEVTLRPQGVGLGAVKEKSKQEIEEEKRQAKIKGVKYEGDSDEERKKKRKKKAGFGGGESGGSGMSTPRKTAKPKFRTLEEVQKAAPGLQIPEAFAPILDMRAPSQRLLTTASGLLTPTAGSGGFETAEQTESKKLARRAQNDLSAYVEEWKNLEERKAYVEMVIVQQQQEMDEEQRQYELMKGFADAVASISQAVRNMEWDPVIEALIAADALLLADEGDYRVNEELSNIAVAAVYPFLRQAVEGWQPLTDPKLNGIAPQLFKVRHILGATTPAEKSTTSQHYLNSSLHRNHTKSSTTYESLIYKLIFPKIVSSITSTWNVNSPTPLLTLLQTWDGLLPSFVRSQIFDQAIVSKLNTAVSSWNPKKRREKDLPHLWLFPWLQYLPSHQSDSSSSTGLVSDVKRKFRSLISTWDFRRGVIPGLEQWKIVLQPKNGNDHWMPLIMNHVLPTMARWLRNPENFLVDPQDQSPYMEALEGVLAWKDILGTKVLGQVLVETVMGMWMGVLHQWLTVVGPNEEIGVWFEWWRDDVFPEDMRALSSIQEQFEKGHNMINQALDLGEKVSTLPLPSTSTQSQPTQSSTPIPAPIDIPAPAKPAPQAPVEEPSFRHRVEDWCIDNDLQFLPEKKVLHSAGPLYRITAAGNGKNGTLVYFRGDAITALVKKGGETGEMRILWENEGARDALLEMAWGGVK